MLDKASPRHERGIPNHMVLSTERYMPTWVSANPQPTEPAKVVEPVVKPTLRW